MSFGNKKHVAGRSHVFMLIKDIFKDLREQI